MRMFSRGLCCLSFFFFFNDTATTEIYTLSLHDALPISSIRPGSGAGSRNGTARWWGRCSWWRDRARSRSCACSWSSRRRAGRASGLVLWTNACALPARRATASSCSGPRASSPPRGGCTRRPGSGSCASSGTTASARRWSRRPGSSTCDGSALPSQVVLVPGDPEHAAAVRARQVHGVTAERRPSLACGTYDIAPTPLARHVDRVSGERHDRPLERLGERDLETVARHGDTVVGHVEDGAAFHEPHHRVPRAPAQPAVDIHAQACPSGVRLVQRLSHAPSRVWSPARSRGTGGVSI